MAYKTYILLGRITKVHGYEGTVTIRLERNISENIPELESVFIETDGNAVPFFVGYAEQPDNQTLRLKFSGYDSENKVKEFVGCRVFLTEPLPLFTLIENPDDLVEFEVISKENISLGKIKTVIENPGQLLISVISDSGKEILLPLHEDLIDEVDHERKILRMSLPEGIADIN